MYKKIKILLKVSTLIWLHCLIAIFLAHAASAMETASSAHKPSLLGVAQHYHNHFVRAEFRTINIPMNTNIPEVIIPNDVKQIIKKQINSIDFVYKEGIDEDASVRRIEVFSEPRIGSTYYYLYNNQIFFKERLDFHTTPSYYSQPGKHGFFVISNKFLYNSCSLQNKKDDPFIRSVLQEAEKYKSFRFDDKKLVNIHPETQHLIQTDGNSIQVSFFENGQIKEINQLSFLNEKIQDKKSSHQDWQKAYVTFVGFVNNLNAGYITFSMRKHSYDKKIRIFIADLVQEKIQCIRIVTYVKEGWYDRFDVTPYRLYKVFSKQDFDVSFDALSKQIVPAIEERNCLLRNAMYKQKMYKRTRNLALVGYDNLHQQLA